MPAFQLGPSPLEAFQIGSQLRGPSALGQFAMSMTQRLMESQKIRETAQAETDQKIRAAGPIAEAEAAAKAKYDPWSNALAGLMGNGGGGDLHLDTVGPSGPTFKSLTGLAAEGGGRFGLLSSGIRQAQKAKQLLFPDGTPNSMRRDLLVRIQNAPIGGTIIPDFKGSRGIGESQDLEFLVSRAIESQLRSESGAAVPEAEVKRATKNFLANAAADPQSAFLRLSELEQTLRGSQTAMDPSGQMGQAVQRRVTPFNRLDERGLPHGSEVLQ